MSSKNLRQKWKEEYCKEWFQFVLDNPQINWDYWYLSSNPNITWEIVKNNPEQEWDYEQFSVNPNITWDIVKFNDHLDWNYYRVSCNPNITWEIIQNNPQIDWNSSILSRNPMTKGFNDYMEKKEELYNIAYKIIDRYTNRDIAEMIMSI